MGKKSAQVTGLTLDSGALIALERGDERVRALLRLALDREIRMTIPAGVLAQAWRGGPRAARIARMVKDRERVDLVALSESEAYAIGELARRCGHADVVDIHVALCARRLGDHVVTSDAEDIARVDPSLPLVRL
jgi:predicted nucleic acid-binding protein